MHSQSIGIYAIENNFKRMKEDHENAKYLETELIRLGFTITRPVETNMVRTFEILAVADILFSRYGALQRI